MRTTNLLLSAATMALAMASQTAWATRRERDWRK